MEIRFGLDAGWLGGYAGDDRWLVAPAPGTDNARRGMIMLSEGKPRRALTGAIFGDPEAVSLRLDKGAARHVVYHYETRLDADCVVKRLRRALLETVGFEIEVDWFRPGRDGMQASASARPMDGEEERAWLQRLDAAKPALAGAGVEVLQARASVQRMVSQAAPTLALGASDIETLRLAFRLGYYERPKRCTMDDLARELGLSKSSVFERLGRVERSALQVFLSSAL